MTRAGAPRGYFCFLLAAVSVACSGAAPAAAEPTFLSQQYPRCTACHYSASGGGLLTPYGRSLSREEISTFGRRDVTAEPDDRWAEETFLFGLLGSEAPLQLGLDARPSRLEFKSSGREIPGRNLLMNLGLQAAWQGGEWTVYGTAGRRSGGGFVSYEHWIRRRLADRLSLRGGRFLPACGVRFADHTVLSRERLDLDDDGRTAATASGRFPLDLNPRVVFVGSVRHRGEAERSPRSTDAGVSLG